MVSEKTLEATEVLKEEIIKGIQEKKGLEITCLNLAKINSTVCDYFVVCHGTSNTHVNAIAESVEENVSKHTGIKPRRREGVANAEWILLDYLDVVVHVFQQQVREYYSLEDLWADAPVIHIED
ncbi:MAG: ribosome silencing factor [Bacteroidetes bacterium]|nr:MAG: ribosome silencing factor [Bacteroidota bacterium]